MLLPVGPPLDPATGRRRAAHRSPLTSSHPHSPHHRQRAGGAGVLTVRPRVAVGSRRARGAHVVGRRDRRPRRHGAAGVTAVHRDRRGPIGRRGSAPGRRDGRGGRGVGRRHRGRGRAQPGGRHVARPVPPAGAVVPGPCPGGGVRRLLRAAVRGGVHGLAGRTPRSAGSARRGTGGADGARRHPPRPRAQPPPRPQRAWTGPCATACSRG